MSNYSPLQTNTLAGFSEGAGMLYLKLLDVYQGDERKAFWQACQYEDTIADTLDRVFRESPSAVSPEVATELHKFFAERYRHNFMKGDAR